MKKGDFLWGISLIVILLIMLLPSSAIFFKSYPLTAGFLKFGILATMGELLAIRISERNWKKPNALIFRILIWGVIGIATTILFKIFGSGVQEAMNENLLWNGGAFTVAITKSFFMNIAFYPSMVIFHKYTDTYIEVKHSKTSEKVTLASLTDVIDWRSLVQFNLFKMIPMFWIPAHTISFLLPNEFRILFAALLSMALGATLALTKKKEKDTNPVDIRLEA